MVCDAADDGLPGEGPQRRPLGVPGPVRSLVDGQRRGGMQRGRQARVPSVAARRTSTDSTGFCFCGIVEEPPRPTTAGSRQLADLGPPQRRHVRRDPAPGVRRGHQCIAYPRHRSSRRVPRRPRRGVRAPPPDHPPWPWRPPAGRPGRPRGRARSSPPCVPAAPPTWTANAARAVSTASAASRTPASQPDALSPKEIGTACCVRVRPAITVVRCSSASRTSAATWSRRLRPPPGRAPRRSRAPSPCRPRPGW